MGGDLTRGTQATNRRTQLVIAAGLLAVAAAYVVFVSAWDRTATTLSALLGVTDEARQVEILHRVAALVVLPLLPVFVTGAAALVATRSEKAWRSFRQHWPWYLMGFVFLQTMWTTCQLLALLLDGKGLDWAILVLLAVTVLISVAYALLEGARRDEHPGEPVTWRTTNVLFRAWMVLALVGAAAVWVWAITTLPPQLPL